MLMMKARGNLLRDGPTWNAIENGTSCPGASIATSILWWLADDVQIVVYSCYSTMSAVDQRNAGSINQYETGISGYDSASGSTVL